MAIPTRCPECAGDLAISRTGMGGPDSTTVVECPECGYEETFP